MLFVLVQGDEMVWPCHSEEHISKYLLPSEDG